MKTNYNTRRATLATLLLLGIGSMGLTHIAQAEPYNASGFNNRPSYSANDYRPEHHRDSHRFGRWYHHDHNNGNKKLVTGLAIGAIAGVLLGR